MSKILRWGSVPLLTIFIGVILCLLFQWLYPESDLSNVITVIVFVAFAIAYGLSKLLKRIKSRRAGDEVQ